MPTFKVFKDGEQIDELVGAAPAKLEVCLIWSSGNIALLLINFVAITHDSAVSRINGGIVLRSCDCIVCL